MTAQNKLTDECALVAGSSSGLGLAIAKALADEGCDLHMAGRNPDHLDDAAEDISDSPSVDVEAHATDLSSAINAAALALECDDSGVLINAFGEAPTGKIVDLEDDDWRQGFELKVFATISLCREMFETLGDTGAGIIINIGCPEATGICADTINATLRTFSERLDEEARRDGVRVLFHQPSPDMDDKENANDIVKIILGHFAS